ncbi:hypothetical protein [Spirosoma terrae]|uniref:Uncharacterized protein n=1 Tax=Spirosoma terrae TaxID=1968276 RepID=A0A6L9KZY3_9BACT|nr:hypothetical protein [Spirosoma terrae]NDU93815.1 hypothetical protein [Spirosoma terrae]
MVRATVNGRAILLRYWQDPCQSLLLKWIIVRAIGYPKMPDYSTSVSNVAFL